MNIAVDIDDTIADLIRSIILFHNDRYGTKLRKEDFFSCWYREVWGGDKKEEVCKLNEFFETNYFKEIIPITGAQQAMNFLVQKGHKLFIVTGRIPSLSQKTRSWIETYFPNIFSEIYHTNSYGITGIKIMKSEICKKLKADFIIDDDPTHIIDCTNCGIHVLIYDNPWNQNNLPKRLQRIKSWEEIFEIIH